MQSHRLFTGRMRHRLGDEIHFLPVAVDFTALLVSARRLRSCIEASVAHPRDSARVDSRRDWQIDDGGSANGIVAVTEGRQRSGRAIVSGNGETLGVQPHESGELSLEQMALRRTELAILQ